MFGQIKTLRCAFAICLVALTGSGAYAGGFAAPKGDVILTLAGTISQTNGADVLMLDQEQMSNLPQHSFATTTIWTEGVLSFQGVLLKDMVAASGATGQTITLVALNDYQISMPMADLRDDGPLLAYLTDGKPMSLRDKGPIWLVFPYDDNIDYRTEQTYSRSIWQLARIEFGP